MIQTNRWSNLLIASLLVLSVVACGKSRQVKISGEAVERSKTAAKLPADIEKLWKNRQNEADLRQALVLLEKFANENPQYTDVKVMLCTGNYLMGDGHLWLKLTGEDSDAAVKEESVKFYDAAVNWCEAGLAMNPAFRKKLTEGVEPEKALDTLTVDDIDSLYWRYASLGKWSRLVGFTTLLANRSKFSAMVNRVKELEKQLPSKEYFYSATLRYEATSNALSPTGDKKLGAKLFEEAIKKHPNYFAVRVLYSESLLKGDETKFQNQLNFVLKGNPKSLPEIEPEQIVEQRKAKKLLDEL
ncbi:TRAP transporter TatT component family protein [Leptospira ilyithenensis]|uniref:Lipoprotein n=1 Tax=Leptospira ilyithenensis TaxID=2484901 RepID=A0A4R9LRM8_9LEPT|nr:TRAP transporter TatT component family protein [Leptospira ilyithenensis]TGN13404.1 hypothetical protein EHS11_04005 [Leptospira ilyithenensis]